MHWHMQPPAVQSTPYVIRVQPTASPHALSHATPGVQSTPHVNGPDDCVSSCATCVQTTPPLAFPCCKVLTGVAASADPDPQRGCDYCVLAGGSAKPAAGQACPTGVCCDQGGAFLGGGSCLHSPPLHATGSGARGSAQILLFYFIFPSL